MTKHKRGLSGSQAAAMGSVGGGESRMAGAYGVAAARDNTEHAKFWVSHRMGPFLIHEVGACELEGNVGFGDDYDSLIGQGFAPCPKCIGGAK